MKLVLTLLAVLAATDTINGYPVPPFGKGPLHDDLQEFLALIPLHKIAAVVHEYRKSDREFKYLELIFYGAENKAFVEDFEAFPETIELFDYLHNAGIYIYAIVNRFNRMLGIEELPVPPCAEGFQEVEPVKITGGLIGLAKDIKALIPVEKLSVLHRLKLQTSPAYAKLITVLSSELVNTINIKIYENVHFQNVLEQIRAIGTLPEEVISYVQHAEIAVF